MNNDIFGSVFALNKLQNNIANMSPFKIKIYNDKNALVEAFYNHYEVEGENSPFSTGEFVAFDYMKTQGMFALITNRFVEALAEFLKGSNVLEIMSGSGILANALLDKGINIIATDDFSWNINAANIVEDIGAIDAITKYGSSIDYVIMSWPPYADEIDYKVLLELRKINPKAQIIFIGESSMGCTGSDKFFDNAVCVNDGKFGKVQESYESWSMIHDYPQLYR